MYPKWPRKHSALVQARTTQTQPPRPTCVHHEDVATPARACTTVATPVELRIRLHINRSHLYTAPAAAAAAYHDGANRS